MLEQLKLKWVDVLMEKVKKGFNKSEEIEKGLSHSLYPVIFCSLAYFRLGVSWLWDLE